MPTDCNSLHLIYSVCAVYITRHREYRRGMATAAANGGGVATGPPGADKLVDTSTSLLQYVVLRRDLWKEQKWPLGSLVAQGCHATTAALWMSRDDACTMHYCSPEHIDHMHKVGFS